MKTNEAITAKDILKGAAIGGAFMVPLAGVPLALYLAKKLYGKKATPEQVKEIEDQLGEPKKEEVKEGFKNFLEIQEMKLQKWLEGKYPQTEEDAAHGFAKEKHDITGKVRKLSGLPYFTHPSNVANLLRSAGATKEVVTAGYLHDTVEDAGVSLEEIKEKFGERVADLVAGASEPDKGASWDERKQHTMHYLSGINDPEVLQVVVADKLDNVDDTFRNGGPGIWNKFNAPYEKQKWYYSTLADIFLKKIPEFPLTRRYKEMVDKVFEK
jgi:hypothetical protein